MSNIGEKIEKLISNGFTYNTLRGLNESQIGLLYTRLIEQPTNPNLEKNIQGLDLLNRKLTDVELKMKKLGLTEKNIDEDDFGLDADQVYTGQLGAHGEGQSADDGMDDDTSPQNNDRKMVGETEVTEKFESKSQQKYFFVKCKTARTEKSKKKWCRMAKEFADDTDFSKLPEKKKKDVKELEENLTKLIERHIPEHITKAKLMEMLESSTKSAPAPTKVPTVKPGEKVKQPGKKNPGVGAPAPVKTPTKTPTKTPSKTPGKQNPFKIEPSQKPNPKAKGPKWLSYNTFTSMGYNLK